MATQRQYAVLGPLVGGVENRAFLGCEVIGGAPRPDSPVVIVWLPDEVARDSKQVSRLQRETAFVTQLRHPNILRTHGLECFEEGWARVLAYEDGELLSALLAKLKESDRQLEPLLAARIIVDACNAVHHAHEEGLAKYAGRPIVHGGLRPDTLFLTFDGRTTVAGFGASVIGDKAAFAYLAPEQIIGGKATASLTTDTYALGAILYELLSGTPPFADAPDVERAVLTGDPPSILEPGLSGRLGNIATVAMSKRGSDRFESVGVMRDAIMTALAGEELPSHEVLARFLSGVFPSEATERANRRSMLESAVDIDSVSVLSRPTSAPPGVDQAFFDAARPGPVSSSMTALVDPNAFNDEPGTDGGPRGDKTFVDVKVPFPAVLDDGRAPSVRDVVPRMMAEDEATEAEVRARPMGAPISEALNDERTGEVSPAQIVSSKPIVETVSAPSSWESMIAQAAQNAASAASSTAPTQESVPLAPQPVQMPVISQPKPVLQQQTAMQSLPQMPAPQPHMQQPQMQQPQMQQPQMQQPQMQQPQMQMMPPPSQPQMPQYPQMGRQQAFPGQQASYPQAQQGQVYSGQQNTLPGQQTSTPPSQNMFLQGQQNMFAQPGYPQNPGTQPQMFNPQHPGTQPQMFNPQQQQRPGMPMIPNLPTMMNPQQQLPQNQPGMPHTLPSFLPPAQAVQQQLQSQQPRPMGPQTPQQSFTTQRPGNGPAAAALRGPAAIPRAPMREQSAITNFDRKVGDSSRAVLIIVLVAAAALLGGIFFWTEATPEVQQLAQEESRHALPKEMVREALEKAGTEKAVEPEPDPEPTPAETAANGKTPATTDEAAPAVPQFGTLNVTTDPEVDVYLGNDSLGRTPLTARLSAGAAKLRFTDKKLGLNVYKTYRVRGGGEVRDHISFGTSELIVEAPDGASILLNSRFVGKAPMESLKIYEGKYHLKVTLDGKSWSDHFDAPPGRKINYKVTLNN
jgi:serine/threonine-protein kinase